MLGIQMTENVKDQVGINLKRAMKGTKTPNGPNGIFVAESFHPVCLKIVGSLIPL
jgi:hypothetical protein